MRVIIRAVGQIKGTLEENLVQRYVTRLNGILSVQEVPVATSSEVKTRKRSETTALLKGIASDVGLFVLDERGQLMSTREVHQVLNRYQTEGIGQSYFLIGGPDGLDREMLPKHAHVLALGRLTWPHFLARVLIAEQVYRVTQLSRQHPYHRD